MVDHFARVRDEIEADRREIDEKRSAWEAAVRECFSTPPGRIVLNALRRDVLGASPFDSDPLVMAHTVGAQDLIQEFVDATYQGRPPEITTKPVEEGDDE